jgi:hypothetical protein
MFGVEYLYAQMSEEERKFLAQEFAGPPKPIPTWQKVAAASLRGIGYVLASPSTLCLMVLFAFMWAFEMKDES